MFPYPLLSLAPIHSQQPVTALGRILRTREGSPISTSPAVKDRLQNRGSSPRFPSCGTPVNHDLPRPVMSGGKYEMRVSPRLARHSGVEESVRRGKIRATSRMLQWRRALPSHSRIRVEASRVIPWKNPAPSPPPGDVRIG